MVMTVISPKIEGLLGMLTIRLNDDNFVKWSFQFQSVLQGYDLFDYFDGSSICPPAFVIDTEFGVTNECVVGSRTSTEAWTHLQDRYATVSRASVNHLKTEFHTMHKGADSIEKYLLRIKTACDQLVAVGERITDDDVVITTLNERQAEIRMDALSHSMNAMMATHASSQPTSGGVIILVVQNIFLKVPAQLKVLAQNLRTVTMVPSFDLLLSRTDSSHLDIMVLDFIPTSMVLTLLGSSNNGVHLLVLSLMLSQNVKSVVRGVTLLPIVFIAILLIQTLLMLFNVRFVVKKRPRCS
ncbi:hypothetical protein L3X38_028079 [Prunus dulcis]|uniref:Retrotransposon Copia-like N-terminal domain-containing protein n=1 Tax=Prunus dulcis TaxID=3755 RepID=A0AAD4VRR7_PRUDU|nr:hypothetical protein L3X38_028079 [Prunus dulcis]